MRSALVGAAVLATLAAIPASAMGLASFHTPSKNIYCVISDGSGRCDIKNKAWSAPKPKGCRLDWGQGLTVTRKATKGRVVCGGDTVLGLPGGTLGYGKSITRSGITCTSRRSGMTCKNPKGHGFTMSAQQYRLF